MHAASADSAGVRSVSDAVKSEYQTGPRRIATIKRAITAHERALALGRSDGDLWISIGFEPALSSNLMTRTLYFLHYPNQKFKYSDLTSCRTYREDIGINGVSRAAAADG